MIKANELRLGNKVHVKGLHGDLFMTVASITGKGSLNEKMRVIFFEEDKEQVGEYLENCHGIALTPEILEKCGFVKTMHDVWQDNKGQGFEIVLLSGKKFWYIDYLLTTPELKYLHQLQNLFFALTGEELTVNL